MLRAFRDESVPETALGELIGGELLWDVRAFYCSLDIPLLVEKVLEQHFSAITLTLELMASVSPRVLRENGCASLPFQTQTSIMAGTASGIDFARVYLYKLLFDIYSRFPAVKLHSWIDDLVQRVEGTKKLACDVLVRVGIDLTKGLSEIGLDVVDKSVVLIKIDEAMVCVHKG